MNDHLDRREFIRVSASIAGGLAIGVSLGAVATVASPAQGQAFEPWLVIDPDGAITVRVTTPEMGTGASSQLAMTIAEELECDWDDIRIEYATLHQDDQFGRIFSRSADAGYAWFSGRSTQERRIQTLLKVGASARERLRHAAALTWREPVSEILASAGTLRHMPTGRTMGYGEAAVLASGVVLQEEPVLKPRGAWELLGKRSPTRLHVPAVTNGTAQYGIDVRLPGMRYAALRQCPVQDGTLKSVNFDAIRSMPGVRGLAVVTGGPPIRSATSPIPEPSVFGGQRTSAVAVVADHYWQARQALEVLPVEWDAGEGVRWTSNEVVFDTARNLLSDKNGVERLRRGDPGNESLGSLRPVEATYTTPYCDQAPLEPLNGTCLVTADRLDLWHPTQFTDQARAAAEEESGFAPENIYVHQTAMGGAFGRRTGADDVRMVVAVARQFPGVPIQVVWSREETMRQGRYRALMAARLLARLDEAGLPQVLEAHSSARPLDAAPPFAGWKDYSPIVGGLVDTPYAVAIVPNVSIVTHDLPIHIRSGAYRGPFYNSNCFYVESFIDECAHAAGIDELEYRLKLFEDWPDKGWASCLKVVAEQAGWAEPLPAGTARGIAIGNFGMFGRPHAGTTVATVATVSVSPKGQARVHSLDVAFDCGSYLNLDAVLAQIEGATIHGYNMAMNETLSIEGGRIAEGNFDRYRIARMGEIPSIRVHTGAISGHERFGEIGEAAIGPVGPAICGAVFKITGKRLRSTPIRQHDLSRKV